MSCVAYVPCKFIVFNYILIPCSFLQRKYAFERSEIPAGENYVVKINYPFKVHF